jgi:hypothetical protein
MIPQDDPDDPPRIPPMMFRIIPGIIFEAQKGVQCDYCMLMNAYEHEALSEEAAEHEALNRRCRETRMQLHCMTFECVYAV